jgi:hypothetical protein
MKFKHYLNELFKQDVELDIRSKWNKWNITFPVNQEKNKLW